VKKWRWWVIGAAALLAAATWRGKDWHQPPPQPEAPKPVYHEFHPNWPHMCPPCGEVSEAPGDPAVVAAEAAAEARGRHMAAAFWLSVLGVGCVVGWFRRRERA